MNQFWNFFNSRKFKAACWLIIITAAIYFGSVAIYGWMFQEHKQQARTLQLK